MNDHRHPRGRRDFELPDEYRNLRLFRHSPVIVQSDLAHRFDFLMPEQVLQIFESAFLDLRSIVRMDAHRGKYKGMRFGEPNGCFKIGRSMARADGQHELQSGFTRALNDGGSILIELRVVEMAMRIGEVHAAYFSRAPTAMSSWNPVRTGRPASVVAATIMPCDVSPRSLRGCRFATITTLRPMSCSGL